MSARGRSSSKKKRGKKKRDVRCASCDQRMRIVRGDTKLPCCVVCARLSPDALLDARAELQRMKSDGAEPPPRA